MAKADREKLERRLAKTRLKLQEADEEVAATRMEGEQAIRQARLQAEKKLAKARRKRARHADKIAWLEGVLSGAEVGGEDVPALTPEEAADRLQFLEEISDSGDETSQPSVESAIITADTFEHPSD